MCTLLYKRSLAAGTETGKTVCGITFLILLDNLLDSGNDITSLRYRDGVAYAELEFVDVFLVVESRPSHRRATDMYFFNLGNRCYPARSADLACYGLKLRLRPGRLELVCYRPPGVMHGVTELLPDAEFVDLEYKTVYLMVEEGLFSVMSSMYSDSDEKLYARPSSRPASLSPFSASSTVRAI